MPMNRSRISGVVVALLIALVPAWTSAEAKRVKRTTCSTVDFLGDARLGPKRLPNSGPLAKVLTGYERLAGMTPKGYLGEFWDPDARTWRYPPQDGYALTPAGMAVKMAVSLFTGQRVDRFGSEFGGYLSPEGTPFGARGIPPQSLDSTTKPRSCNYSRYRVLKTIPVLSGPIAPALGQPGFGLQYVLDSSIFPGAPAGPRDFNVGFLVTNGYLARVTS